ncbi:MAG: SCO family protein [Pseudomonas sp.]|uniref:SCO family protein n=1 Tax=Pseudomonas abieticivorans TaxID=2931382 RepID=UPI0020BDC987|nr:SCO family protein [Pseudomonas sp. PIA16]MDE1164581.1 SCO family protein [Pseudomonas sp.]
MNTYPSCALMIGLLALGAGPAQAHSADEHAGHGPAKPRLEATRVTFADVPLTDQAGKPIRLEKDLLANKIVVMGFIYTRCTTVCPVVSSIMGKVQQQLGGRVGTEVQLVSISVDPLRDDPPRLAAYARQFQHGPGWSWLTGSSQSITATLKGLGSWSPNLLQHPPLILVGDGNSPHWTRYYGFTDPAVLVREVDELSSLHRKARRTVIAQDVQP